jgi:hypothetical protein
VTGPIHAGAGFQNGGVLGFNPTELRVGGHPATLFPGGWRYGAPTFTDFGTTSLSELDANFNNGVYNVTVNGTSLSLNLSGPNGADEFPNTPILTLSGGAWSGGMYLIDPSHALTITTNAFSAYGQNPHDYMFLGSTGTMNNVVFFESQFFSDVPGTNFLTFTVPAFSFIAGNAYDIVSAFRLVTDSSNAIAGSENDAFFEMDTFVRVSAVPEPTGVGRFRSGWARFVAAAQVRLTALSSRTVLFLFLTSRRVRLRTPATIYIGRHGSDQGPRFHG